MMHFSTVSAIDLRPDTLDGIAGLSAHWHIGEVPGPKLKSQVRDCLAVAVLYIEMLLDKNLTRS
jgi:hypothetical protein